MKKCILVLAMVLSLPIILRAITFERIYGGGDAGYSVQQTLDRGYIIAGCTQSTGTYDVYMIKTDSLGDTLWTRTYGGNSDDYGWSVQQTSDSGYILAGLTYSYGPGTPDYANVWLIKTNSSGDTLWTRTFDGGNDDFGYSVQQTSDGGYIIAGASGNVWLIKTDSSGDTLWTRKMGYGWGQSVQQTSDGGYIIAGGRPVFLIKTNSLGDTIWTHAYGAYEWANSVQQTQDNGYIIGGYTWSWDVCLIKTNSLGDSVWTHTYGGSNQDWGESVRQTSDEGYIIAGCTESFGAGWYDVYLIKTDASGDTLWTRTFGGDYHDVGESVRQTMDGGYIITGTTNSSGDGVYLIKTDALGNVGIKQKKDLRHKTRDLRLFCHPNPFTTSTTITFTLSSIGHPDGIVDAFHRTSGAEGIGQSTNDTKLKIYDVSGRLVKEFSLLPFNFLLSTTVEWDSKDDAGNELQGGVYFIKLTSGNFISISKVILVR